MKRQQKKQNKDWLDWWLSDEEPSPELGDKINAPYAPDRKGTSMFDTTPEHEETEYEPASTNFTLNMRLPKVSKSGLQKFESLLPQREIARLALFAVFMMLVGLGVRSFIFKTPAQPASANTQQVLGANSGSSSNPISISSSPTGVSSGQSANQIPFTPVAPATKPQLANSDFASTTYNSQTGVYGYVDNILNNPFNVSEQLIPSNYQNASDALTQLSASINANQQVSTSNGLAYIYTNPKSGQQTVIFSMKSLLIYINSNTQHSSDVWKAYINTLK